MGEWAAIITASIIGVSGTVIVAIWKFIPPRRENGPSPFEARVSCNEAASPMRCSSAEGRIASIESRLAVQESQHANLTSWMKQLSSELHQVHEKLQQVLVSLAKHENDGRK